MKALSVTFLLLCCISGFSQRAIDSVSALINSHCLGSTSKPGIEKQSVLCRATTSNVIEMEAYTTDVITHRLLRENKYSFSLKDLDHSNIVIKQFGNYYGLFLYTKDAAKKIRQSMKLSTDQQESVFMQEKICISDFESKETVEKIKKEFERLILASGTN